GPILTPQSQPPAVAERRARNPRDVSVGRGDRLAGGCLPDLDHPVHAHGDEAPAVGTKGQTVGREWLLMRAIDEDPLTGAKVPEPHRAVHTRRAQAPAVRAKC